MPTQELPEGLHVALCGSGSPLPDPTRAGPCSVVIAGKHVFVVDAGEGGARNMTLMRIPNGHVEAVFLTHLHSDHIDGLGPMMLLRWTGANATVPLPIYGPAGTERVVAGVNEAYAIDGAIAPRTTVRPSRRHRAGGTAYPFALPPRGMARPSPSSSATG
jgi:ribonuclease Z